MPLTPTVATLATAGAQKLRELPMPTWVFGLIAFGCFMVLLGVLWSFRHTAAKYDKPAGAGHGDSRRSYGATDHGAQH